MKNYYYVVTSRLVVYDDWCKTQMFNTLPHHVTKMEAWVHGNNIILHFFTKIPVMSQESSLKHPAKCVDCHFAQIWYNIGCPFGIFKVFLHD